MKSHINTASHFPESYLFQMLFHQPTAQICPPVQDTLTAGPQSLAGLSWLLGAKGSQILFPAQELPWPHLLCCLPVQPSHCPCSNHATNTPLLPVVPPQGTVRAAQHAPSLWQKVSYKRMARPTQTDKQGLRGRVHLPLTVQAPASPECQKAKKSNG